MDIEFRHLRYFIAVAEEVNFRRAVERIHIDQTLLSRAIRDLDDQLGVPLFMCMPLELRLTPAGVHLLKEAHKLFIRLERARRGVRATNARYRAPFSSMPVIRIQTIHLAMAAGFGSLKALQSENLFKLRTTETLQTC